MVSMHQLTHGDCITCRVDGNFASGRIVEANGRKYFVNNDYSNCMGAITGGQDARFGYKKTYLLNDTPIVSKIKIVSLEKLPYKTGDILDTRTGEQVKILGRSANVHHLSMIGDFEKVGHSMTRKQLDAAEFSLHTEEEEICDECGEVHTQENTEQTEESIAQQIVTLCERLRRSI